MGKHRITRRQFTGRMAGTAAVGWAARSARSADRVAGANERLAVGIVGPGERGIRLMEWVQRLSQSQNVELTAVCDIWNRQRERAAARVHEWTGRKPLECRTLSEICDRSDVDVLVIATPDFQHAPQTRQAVEAGKDVYVEKPFGCDFEQIKQARDAVKKTERIVQQGTFRRSHTIPWTARDLVQSGRLGRISYVEMAQPLFQQRWRIPDSENSLTEKDTNWPEFLSYTPEVVFDARKYREFRLFWPYSTGIFCQWMSHAIDMVNLVLGEPPRSVVANGGVYVWRDGRTNPDTVQCLFEYPGGCLVSYHMRLGNSANRHALTFYGTNGTLDLYGGIAYGDGGGGEVVRDRGGRPVPEFATDGSRRLPDRVKGGLPLRGEPDGDHMVDFFEAVRQRRRPKADIDAGFQHALATTMAGLALRTGARVVYDADADALRISQPAADELPSAVSETQAG